MANEKVYTAKEAAFAVLAKAQELLVKSEFVKSEMAPKNMDHEGRCEVHADKDAKSFAKSENCGMCKGEKGVHQKAFDSGAGHSTARPQGKNSMAIEHSKGQHKRVLSEMSAMPKPNLPKSESADENEIGTKFVKAENKEAPSTDKNAPKEEQAPQRDAKNFETQPGKAAQPADARQAPQAAPSANPKEQAEGNNPPSGAVPGKGLHKLAFFMGHTHHKRKSKKVMV